MLRIIDWWRKNVIVLFDFLFNLDYTFFRDLNQVRSTSLKLNKYFSSFVQEKDSIKVSFFILYTYYSTFPFTWLCCHLFIWCSYRSILYWPEYIFSSCRNRNESRWSFERELVFTKLGEVAWSLQVARAEINLESSWCRVTWKSLDKDVRLRSYLF